MIRIVPARNDLLTSFDLRAHIFRVDLEFATFYHNHTNKNFFEHKVTFGHFYCMIFAERY